MGLLDRPSRAAVLLVALALGLSADVCLARSGRFVYNSFRPGRAQKAAGVEMAASGALSLKSVKGKRVVAGQWICRAERPSASFDLLRPRVDADVPRGTRVLLMVRTVDHSSGAASEWVPVTSDAPLRLDSPAEVFQLKVRLESEWPDRTPHLKKIEISCSRSRGSGSRRRSRGSYTAKHRNPPGFKGPVVKMPRPAILTRATWGSLPPRDRPEDLQPTKVAVHHSCVPRASRWQGASTIRGIQRYHMDIRGWNDIGYHYLIGPDGSIHQGRPEGIRGAHARPNRDKFGICVLGNFNRSQEAVSAPARKSLVALLAYLMGKYGMSPWSIYGHRDFNPTDCPGDLFYEQLQQVRQEVGELLDREQENRRKAARTAPGSESRPGAEQAREFQAGGARSEG